jgi:hypothetical protein
MHECPSVPTALDVAAQHLVIKVGVAVSQNLIETVQLRARRASFSVNVRNKYSPTVRTRGVSVFAADFAILAGLPIVETSAHADVP